MYSFPSTLNFPASFTLASEPKLEKSSNAITSARMNPFSKSVWITPAAFGAVSPMLIVQARTSLTPAVKYVCNFNYLYAARINTAEPGSVNPMSSKNT
jgi:hypothetical protein